MLARFVLAELVRETQDEAETTPAVGSSAPHLQLTMLKSWVLDAQGWVHTLICAWANIMPNRRGAYANWRPLSAT